MNETVNILTDDDQIFVLGCATEIPGQFAVAVDVANLQQFSSHSAFAELSAVEGNAIIIVSR